MYKRLDAHEATISGLVNPGPLSDTDKPGEQGQRRGHSGIGKLHEALARQGAKLDKVIERMTEGNSEKWTEVVKKRPKTRRQTTDPQPEIRTPAPRPPRSLPKAVVIKRGELSFAESVKNIRSKVDANVVGHRISKIRQTRTGDVLIEILGGSEAAETVRSEVEKSLASGEIVKSLEQRTLVQLRDLDCVTVKTDVQEALSDETGIPADQITVTGIRPAFGGKQSTIVSLPREIALKIIGKGRIRVGLIYSWIREALKLTRCFRCLQDGHDSKNCTSEDRSKVCRRCGIRDHHQTECKAKPQEVQAYRLTDL